MKTPGDHGPSASFEALGAREQRILLQVARLCLRDYFEQTVPSLPGTEEPKLQEKHGCFVTLTRSGTLRGCVGNVVPRLPLCRAVVENACSAAFCDSRFPPLERKELGEISIEISVLTAPEKLQWHSGEELLAQLRPGVDGVLLQEEGRISTFLPQVWEKLPSRVDFMNCLARKCGLSPSAWRNPSAIISIYQAQSFSEETSG